MSTEGTHYPDRFAWVQLSTGVVLVTPVACCQGTTCTALELARCRDDDSQWIRCADVGEQGNTFMVSLRNGVAAYAADERPGGGPRGW